MIGRTFSISLLTSILLTSYGHSTDSSTASVISGSALLVAESQAPLTDKEKKFLRFGDEEIAPACTKPEFPQGFESALRQRYLQAIYERMNYESISEAGSCSCDRLYPPYHKAVAEFQSYGPYSAAVQRQWVDRRNASEERVAALLPNVKALCSNVGSQP